MNIEERIELEKALGLRWEYEGPREICGLSGQVSVPPYNQGDQSPVVVYNQQLAAAVASIPTTTLLTAPASGTYLILVQGSTTVLGSGATSTFGYHTLSLGFTDPVGAAQTFSLGVLTLGTGSNYNGVLGNCPVTTAPMYAVVRCKAGTAITIATTLTAAGGSPAPEPNIVLTCTVISLGT